MQFCEDPEKLYENIKNEPTSKMRFNENTLKYKLASIPLDLIQSLFYLHVLYSKEKYDDYSLLNFEDKDGYVHFTLKNKITRKQVNLSKVSL